MPVFAVVAAQMPESARERDDPSSHRQELVTSNCYVSRLPGSISHGNSKSGTGSLAVSFIDVVTHGCHSVFKHFAGPRSFLSALL